MFDLFIHIFFGLIEANRNDIDLLFLRRQTEIFWNLDFGLRTSDEGAKRQEEGFKSLIIDHLRLNP